MNIAYDCNDYAGPEAGYKYNMSGQKNKMFSCNLQNSGDSYEIWYTVS